MNSIFLEFLRLEQAVVRLFVRTTVDETTVDDRTTVDDMITVAPLGPGPCAERTHALQSVR